MKTKSKQQILYWGVKPQLDSRPNKLAKGIAFTNERRARIKNKSVFFSFILSNNNCSKESRSLSVKGTLDKLASINSVNKYNWKRYKLGLPQQRPSKNKFEYLKAFI